MPGQCQFLILNPDNKIVSSQTCTILVILKYCMSVFLELNMLEVVDLSHQTRFIFRTLHVQAGL